MSKLRLLRWGHSPGLSGWVLNPSQVYLQGGRWKQKTGDVMMKAERFEDVTLMALKIEKGAFANGERGLKQKN